LADGRLTLAELQSGKVDLSAARLVTLSACETGLSDIGKSSAEEYVGLPAGFMLAGAPCVVSSLWVVLDLSTALLMERFYRNHLNDEMDFAAALREAQAWVRGLGAGEVTQYAEQCYQQSKWRDKAELLKLVRHYRYLAEQNPTCQPFAHPYYWAAFTVNGM
jgi:CHAT domain-containing protein